MTKVKICGITNLEDARHSIDCGADALGFNFYNKSPRYISMENAKEIINQLPDNVEKVGVFVNEDMDKIVEIADVAGLDTLQLHGDETPAFVAEIAAKTELPMIKAMRVSSDFIASGVADYDSDAVLLDTFSADQHGGSGKVFNWEIARVVVQSGKKLYLAGGLSPENVADAIKAVRPYAVDACSLLEIEPGHKDHEKVAAFIKAAKEAI